MKRILLFLSFLPSFYGIQMETPQKGTSLQCQCTCRPAADPRKTLYTSGNMHVVEKSVVMATDGSTKSNPNEINNVKKPTLPQVEGSKYPINTEITEFKDVAVSKVRHSLGSGANTPNTEDIGQSSREPTEPKIKWLHSASSKDVVEAAQKSAPNMDNNTFSIHGEARGTTGSLMKIKETTISETAIEKPTQSQVSSLLVSRKNVVQNNNRQSINKDLVDNSRKVDMSNKAINYNTNSRTSEHLQLGYSASQDKNSDKVAADIGFVLDGSVPNPILSAGLSGMASSSLGSGYIVENINGDPYNPTDKPKFVPYDGDTKSSLSQMVHAGQSISSPQVSVVSQSISNSPDGQGTSGKNVNKVDTEGSTNQKTEKGIVTNTKLTNKARDGVRSDARENMQISNKKSNNDVTINRGNTINWKNQKRSFDKNTQQLNRDGQVDKNIKGQQQKNQGTSLTSKILKTQWPKQKSEMKSFHILRDQKQGQWVNNNNPQTGNSNWGNNNWGTTTTPSVTMGNIPFGMMSMDPIMFLGQHQF